MVDAALSRRLGNVKDISGSKIGRLEVVSFSRVEKEKSLFLCRCDCGTEKELRGATLLSGLVQSCGCLRREKARELGLRETHGRSGTRLCRIYASMMARCYNQNHKFYRHYGGRGVRICDEWLNSKEEFFQWAIASGYKDDLVIDRRDNDLSYCAENCRWITNREKSEQQAE